MFLTMVAGAQHMSHESLETLEDQYRCALEELTLAYSNYQLARQLDDYRESLPALSDVIRAREAKVLELLTRIADQNAWQRRVGQEQPAYR